MTSIFNSFHDLERNDLSLDVNEEGNTALHEALIHKRNGVIDYFLGKMDSREAGLFHVNKDGKSPVYLVVEAEDVRNLKIMLKILSAVNPIVSDEQVILGKSLIHAAILRKNISRYF